MSLIPDRVLAEIRARLPIAEVVARHVPLRRSGRWLMGCCPFHGEKNPSFGIKEGTAGFHCFGCGAHGDVIGFVARMEGVTFPQAVARCAAEAGIGMDVAEPAAPWAKRPAPAAVAPAAVPDKQRRDVAARLWSEDCGPIDPQGAAAAYLDGRGLWPLPAACHAVLREGPMRHPETAQRHPALVARIDGADGAPCGIHRVFLAPREGGGVGKLQGVRAAKLALGDLGGGAAIRLFPAGDALGVAEGIETALAAHRLSGLPVWSCISAGGIERVVPPFEVSRVVVFADRDPPREGRPQGQGVHSAWQLAARLKRWAVAVEVRAPVPPAEDYADAWLAQRREAVPA